MKKELERRAKRTSYIYYKTARYKTQQDANAKMIKIENKDKKHGERSDVLKKEFSERQETLQSTRLSIPCVPEIP